MHKRVGRAKRQPPRAGKATWQPPRTRGASVSRRDSAVIKRAELPKRRDPFKVTDKLGSHRGEASAGITGTDLPKRRVFSDDWTPT